MVSAAVLLKMGQHVSLCVRTYLTDHFYVAIGILWYGRHVYHVVQYRNYQPTIVRAEDSKCTQPLVYAVYRGR